MVTDVEGSPEAKSRWIVSDLKKYEVYLEINRYFN